MKKRIISLILVVAMALLTLASCGFNYSNEKMGNYATFDAAVFKDKIAALKIDDGEFSQADATKRENMVMDAIWAAIAGKADTTDKLVGKVDDPETDEDEAEEAIGEHDLVYYCYYVTATVDGKEYMFLTKNMKTDAASKVQLGKLVFTEEEALDEKILEAIKGFTFTEDGAYAQVSSGTITADQYVYVSYVRTHEETNAEGVVTKIVETVTDERVQVGKGDDSEFTKLLEGKSIGSAEITGITEVTIGDVKYTYDDVYVKYAEKSGTEFTVKHTPYDKEDYPDGKKEDATYYKGSDSSAKQIDLAGVELTYHIFPAHYVKVADYTAETILNDVLGTGVSIDIISKVVFGNDYLKFLEEDHAEEGHDHAKELEDLYDTVMLKDKDGKDVDVNEFVKLLATAMSDYKTAKEAYDKALTAYETAYDDYKTAYEAFYGDGKDVAGAVKNYEDAKAAAKAAADALSAAAKAYNDAVAADNAVSDDALNAALELIKNDAVNKLDLERKENAVKDAEEKVTKAETAVADAEKALAESTETDKTALEAAVTSAKAELEAAKKALTDAQAAKDATVIKTAEKNAAVDADKIKVLEAAKTTAEEAKVAADKDETTKKSTWESKWKSLQTERKDFTSARKTLYGTPDYFIADFEDADYATKLKAYEDALAALEADKTNADLKAAFIAARKAISYNPDDPTTTDKVEEDKAPETDPTPADSSFKKDGGKDKDHTDKMDARDKLVKTFTDKLTEKSLDFKFQYEYFVQYKNLENSYILETKKAIAKIIYNEIFVPSVTVKEAPKSEVDRVYNELIDNFQFFFYENYDLEKWLADGYTMTLRDDKVARYYDMYGASFERFMTEYAVKAAFGENVENYTQAKNAVKARATAIVTERLVVYTVAEGIGVKFTDASFKEYAKSEKGIEDIFQYDDSVVEDYRVAYQLEKILDTVIGITETLATEGAGAKGYKPTNITLNKDYFKDGVVPCKEETKEETENESTGA